jgi:protein-tyrosine phosphatase
MRLLFVCLGNICRSPTAEGVMAHLVRERGLDGEVELDSAGTGSWHVGHAPDERSTSTAASRGIELTSCARQVEPADFERFDLVLAMDSQNHAELARLAPDEAARGRLAMLRQFDPEAVAAGDLDVPDPYYGGPEGFEDVLDLVTRACEGLLEHVVDRRAA